MVVKNYRLVAIVGSRTDNKDDYFRCGRIVGHAFKILNKNTDIIVSGGAPSGADSWAKKYCSQYCFRYLEAHAFWDGPLGKEAGFDRNETIAIVCHSALVVWNGRSRGTANVIENLEFYGKPYWCVAL